MAYSNERNFRSPSRSGVSGYSDRGVNSSSGPFGKYVPITEDNYVEQAEKSIRYLNEYKDRNGRVKPVLTTSKIRNILSLNSELYNDVINEPNEQLSMELKGRINYLKVRIIYEAGREESVKNFVDESYLLRVIDAIKGSRNQYLLFSRYLEALVAYRKFIFGKDSD